MWPQGTALTFVELLDWLMLTGWSRLQWQFAIILFEGMVNERRAGVLTRVQTIRTVVRVAMITSCHHETMNKALPSVMITVLIWRAIQIWQ